MRKEVDGYFMDDGTPINPDLVPKPALCVTCIHDDNFGQEVLCSLPRIDQQQEKYFMLMHLTGLTSICSIYGCERLPKKHHGIRKTI